MVSPMICGGATETTGLDPVDRFRNALEALERLSADVTGVADAATGPVSLVAWRHVAGKGAEMIAELRQAAEAVLDERDRYRSQAVVAILALTNLDAEAARGALDA